MKKDYITAESEASASAASEEFWTGRWDEKNIEVKDLSTSEEWGAIAGYFDKLPMEAKILDAGCGTGEWVLWLLERGFDVTGIDISDKTVKRLNAAFPGEHFKTGDVLNLDCDTESFDAVISWGVFEHFEEGMQKPLREAARVLKKGGMLMISVPHDNLRHGIRGRGNLESWDGVFSKSGGYTKPVRFYQWRMTMEELRRELLIAGYKPCAINPIYKRDGFQRFLEWDMGLKPGSMPFRVINRIVTATGMIPKSFSHMIIAVAEKI